MDRKLSAQPGPNESPLWKLYSTTNTFTISPATPLTYQKSLIIDKGSIKMKEHDIVIREDAGWIIDIQGFLGILNILGIEHLMVVMAKQEVCKLQHKLQPSLNKPALIYELQQIELIPFQLVEDNPTLEYQLKSIREGIKKFLECGFYFAYGFDLTSNTQRRQSLQIPVDGQETSQIDPLISLDYRYMWNSNLYKQLRIQHIPNCWMIPLIQGYVGHSTINDLEIILISRRRWQMGGTRHYTRGIDEEGNAGNTVETEQIVIKHIKNQKYYRILTYAFTQLRGSLPFYWSSEGGKVKIDRSLDSSRDGFIKHTESILNDYNGDAILLVNLLCQSNQQEETLTQGLRKMMDDTGMHFQKKNKRIDYDYFDFHLNYKKGGIAMLDQYINDMLMNLYLRDINIFQEKYTQYMSNGQITKESRKIICQQKGIVRTNCLDCLDRTNVFQAKICLRVFDELLRNEFMDFNKVMIEMWTISGDFISKIYAGTQTMLQTLVANGTQSFLNKIDNGVTSIKRFLKHNLSDDFKQECILILSGQHELCKPTPSNIVTSFIVKEIDKFTDNQKLNLHITTLNCGGKQPDSYKELVPIFQTENGHQPDIIVIGLQEMVKLNAVSIFKGKNKTKIKEWEQLLRSALESVGPTRQSAEDRYVWIIAKSMVGCFIGLFVKQKLLSRLKDLRTTKIKTGLGGSSGNKGAVIVRFKLDDTSIMLINCHLMSGKNKGNKRTDEINFIFDNAFKNESKNRNLCIENHDMVFMLGDLNFRVNLPNEYVRAALAKKDLAALKQQDELIQAFKMYSGSTEYQYQIFRLFQEGEMNFPPTYKYDKKTQIYDSGKKKRVPSWCDRILWKKNEKVHQISLKCMQDVIFSDHRPVVSQFEIVMNKINEYKTGEMVEKYFEHMRFQSQHALGKERQLSEMESNNAIGSEDDIVSSFGYRGDQSEQQDQQLSEDPEQISENREGTLVPMIEEGDDEEECKSPLKLNKQESVKDSEDKSSEDSDDSSSNNNTQKIQANEQEEDNKFFSPEDGQKETDEAQKETGEGLKESGEEQEKAE